MPLADVLDESVTVALSDDASAEIVRESVMTPVSAAVNF